jgi:hypothetical protein
MLGLIISVIIFGVIGAIVYALYSIWLTVKPYVNFVFDAFKKLCEVVITLEQAIQGPILSVINTIGGSVGSIEGLVNQIIGLVSNLAGGLGKGVSSALSSVTSMIPSDERIKENINNADMNEILSKINKLQFKNYNYINKNQYKGNKVYGLLAQDVVNVIPEAVNLTTEYLPNIMKYSESINIVNDKVIINIVNNNILKVGDYIKLVINKYGERIVKVHGISDNSITVSMWHNIDTTEKVLVYGSQVNDYHTLDASYLGILALAGVKELYQQIEKIKLQNKNI